MAKLAKNIFPPFDPRFRFASSLLEELYEADLDELESMRDYLSYFLDSSEDINKVLEEHERIISEPCLVVGPNLNERLFGKAPKDWIEEVKSRFYLPYIDLVELREYLSTADIPLAATKKEKNTYFVTFSASCTREFCIFNRKINVDALCRRLGVERPPRIFNAEGVFLFLFEVSKDNINLVDAHKMNLDIYTTTPIIGQVKSRKIVMAYRKLGNSIFFFEISSKGLKEIFKFESKKRAIFLEAAPAVTNIPSNGDHILIPIWIDGKKFLNLYTIEKDGLELVDRMEFRFFSCDPVIFGLGKERYGLVGGDKIYVVSLDSGLEIIKKIPISCNRINQIAVTDINGEKFATVAADNFLYLIQLTKKCNS